MKDLLNLSILWKDPAKTSSLPESNEFSYSPSIENRRYRKVMGFHLFSQDIFSEWVKKISSAIKKISMGAIVTVGQDETGTYYSPSPQVHYHSVDYTCIHTWWNNSDLLWDEVMTKVPEKPNLVQETGMMRLEDIDGICGGAQRIHGNYLKENLPMPLQQDLLVLCNGYGT